MSYTGLVKSLPKSLPINLPHGLAKQGGVKPTVFELSGSLPDGNQGTDYVGSLAIIGGTAPYLNPQVVAGTLPADFSLHIAGGILEVLATAPIAFSGTVHCSLTVDDSASHTTPAYPVTFTITTSNFIVTEDGKLITTEDGKFLVTET